MRKLQLTIKYAFDLILALILLIPLTLVIFGLGIILYLDSPGPVFFKQLRLGKGGRLFKIFKLRTMFPGDHTGATPRNADGSLAITNDLNGYTRFGRLLRRSSLDELPQIFNILKGEMSFIGPRPDLPEHLEQYNSEERIKLQLRPGLTGLAQVMGRNELPWRERLKLDRQYVLQYSLWLDLKVLVATIRGVFTGRGVYQQ